MSSHDAVKRIMKQVPHVTDDEAADYLAALAAKQKKTGFIGAARKKLKPQGVNKMFLANTVLSTARHNVRQDEVKLWRQHFSERKASSMTKRKREHRTEETSPRHSRSRRRYSSSPPRSLRSTPDPDDRGVSPRRNSHQRHGTRGRRCGRDEAPGLDATDFRAQLLAKRAAKAKEKERLVAQEREANADRVAAAFALEFTPAVKGPSRVSQRSELSSSSSECSTDGEAASDDSSVASHRHSRSVRHHSTKRHSKIKHKHKSKKHQKSKKKKKKKMKKQKKRKGDR